MNAKTRTIIMVLAIAAVCSFAMGRVNAKMTPDEAKAKQAYAIGVQAHLYGQPLMDLYRTFYEGTLDPKRGHDRTLNEFNYSRKLITAKDTWVVSPNTDTLYSRGFLDLTDEPVVLHIPDMSERNYWFPLGDTGPERIFLYGVTGVLTETGHLDS